MELKPTEAYVEVVGLTQHEFETMRRIGSIRLRDRVVETEIGKVTLEIIARVPADWRAVSR